MELYFIIMTQVGMYATGLLSGVLVCLGVSVARDKKKKNA